MQTPSLVVATTIALSLLAMEARAQWHQLPYNPAAAVTAGDWCVAHDTGNGLYVFSAIAQTWVQLSPAGSSFVQVQDSAIVTRESATSVRGWSAFTNTSATQTVSPNAVLLTDATASSFIVLRDDAPGTNGVLRAYSAYTNLWSSQPLTLPPNPFGPWRTGRNVGMHADGTQMHAFSAHLGLWSSHAVQGSFAPSIVGVDFGAHYLNPTAQYLAYSALHGTWSVSPVMMNTPIPGSDPPVVWAANASAFSIRVQDATFSPPDDRHAGFSAHTGQWHTSSWLHTPNTYTTGSARENLVKFLVATPVPGHYEVFAATTGSWSELHGSNSGALIESFNLYCIADSTTVNVTSALHGGFQALSAPGIASVSPRNYLAGIVAGSSPTAMSAWAYSAITNSFAGPAPLPPLSSQSIAFGDAAGGFVANGTAGIGTAAQAFSARWGTWVPGPTVTASSAWRLDAIGSIVLVTRTSSNRDFHVFDEHGNRWLPPLTSGGLPDATLGPNCVVLDTGSVGTYHGYSAQRGDWSTLTGAGTITNPTGIQMRENLAWFTSSSQTVVVFATPGRAQVWNQMPLSLRTGSRYSAAGAGPYIGISARGAPTEYGLLYAALALPPSPITIPGVLGALDLDAAGAVQVADLGLFDADGIREAYLQFGSAVPAGIQLWLQLVTVDLGSGQIAIHDRATGTFLF